MMSEHTALEQDVRDLQAEVERLRAQVAAVEALADELETFAKDGELNNGIAYGWRQGVQIAAHNLRQRLDLRPLRLPKVKGEQ